MTAQHCLLCRFCLKRPTDPKNLLQVVHECRRGPPTPMLVPHNQGVGMTAAFPIVTDKMLCWDFQPIAESSAEA